MITLPAKYEAASSPQHIVADWLLELAYDDTTPGTFYMSAADRTVTNFYDGIVLNWGQIDEKLDLANSSASVSDIKITVANKWNNASGLLSAELKGGTKKFINQNVVIRSWLLGCAVTADCLIRYTGRLVDISHDAETVTFKIEHREPWDRVTFPTNKISDADAAGSMLPDGSLGKYKQIPYGDFQREPDTATAADLDLSRIQPFSTCIYLGLDSDDKHRWQISDKQIEVADALWMYDEDIERMVRLSAFTVVSNDSSGCIIKHDNLIDVYDYWYNDADVVENTANAGSIADAANLGDADKDSKATLDCVDTINLVAQQSLAELHAFFNPWDNQPVIDAANIVAVENFCRSSFEDETYVGNSEFYLESGSGGGTYNLKANVVGTIYNMYDSMADEGLAAAAAITDFPIFVLKGAFSTPGGSADDNFAYPYLIFKRIKYTPLRLMPLFFGGNGIEKCSWTDGTALDANLPHRVHRDLIKNWSTWDATGINHVQVNNDDWDVDIDTDRNWLIKLWVGTKTSLQTLLERLQFEGCFIWFFDATTSGVEARVVYVKSSYAAGDVKATLDGDYLGAVKVDYTPISRIVSKRLANYNKQTISEEFLDQNEKTNSNRGDWNFATEENIVEDDLEFLTVSADVDDFLTYYDNINGEPKLIVSANLEDPANWNLQRGDIIQFTNMETEPFGETWSGKYFMITKPQISPDKFNMTAQEVG